MMPHNRHPIKHMQSVVGRSPRAYFPTVQPIVLQSSDIVLAEQVI